MNNENNNQNTNIDSNSVVNIDLETALSMQNLNQPTETPVNNGVVTETQEEIETLEVLDTPAVNNQTLNKQNEELANRNVQESTLTSSEEIDREQINNFNSNISYEPVNAPITTPTYTSNLSDDHDKELAEELLKAFIGNNYEKLTTRQFNISAFFFTGAYMFYRKLTGYAILYFLLVLIIQGIFKIIPISIVFNILVGLFFNKFYVNYAKKRVNKIKNANVHRQPKDIKLICMKSGGVSVGNIFLGLLLEIIITFLLAFALMYAGMSFLSSNMDSIMELFNKKIQDGINNIDFNTTGEYDGTTITDTTLIMKDEFIMSVPGVFTNSSEAFNYSYSFKEESDFNKCEFTFESIKGYSTSKSLIKQMAKYYKNDIAIDVTKNTINNLDWYWFKTKDSFSETYYYGVVKNNKVYLLKYEDGTKNSNECENYRTLIINSIKTNNKA